ncbi:hypothetical protein RZS08_17825, partial [Arthrospira platensis SPKY1]|nr:hypothetical protein [Arthrospira platensis SPKY1]
MGGRLIDRAGLRKQSVRLVADDGFFLRRHQPFQLPPGGRVVHRSPGFRENASELVQHQRKLARRECRHATADGLLQRQQHRRLARLSSRAQGRQR